MKRLIDFDGGRNLVNDDLETLQTQITLLMSFFYQAVPGNPAGPGPFVLSGCVPTNTGGNIFDISSGKVFINGKILDFPAQVGIDLSTGRNVSEAPVAQVDDRPYTLDAATKPGAEEYSVQITAATSPATGENILLPTTGYMRRLRHALDTIMIPEGTLRPYIGDESDFDGNGKGIRSMMGWVFTEGNILADANAIDLRDRFLIGAGNAFAVGDTNSIDGGAVGGGQGESYAVRFLQYIGTDNLWVKV